MELHIDISRPQIIIRVGSDNTDRNKHSGLYIALSIFTDLVFVATIVFNALAAVGLNGLFTQTVGDVLYKFQIEITPARWSLLILTCMFTFLAAWRIYSLTTLCRKDKNGNYLYLLKITPAGVHIAFVINNLLYTAWLFLFDRELFIVSLAIICLVGVTLIISFLFSYVSLDQNTQQLRQMKIMKEIWLVRILLQNGLALYGGWVFVANLLNLSIVMSYYGIVTAAWSSTISLIILAVVLIIFFTLDVFVLAKYKFFTFALCIPIIIALAGSLHKNFDLTMARLNTVFTIALLAITSLFMCLKLTCNVIAFFKTPQSVSPK